ncbi:M56 family metallopeptidase [Ekhidna sp.]
MKELITFTIEFILVSITFYLGLQIIKKHTTATFKRYYFLTWMALSVLLPLVTFESTHSSDLSVDRLINESANRPDPNYELKEYHSQLIEEGKSTNQAAKVKHVDTKNSDFSWIALIKIGYLFVVGLLVVRIVIGIGQILRLRINAIKSKDELGSFYVVKDSSFKGASFFGWIFIGETLDESRQVILKHERIHKRMHHSLDILLSHLYCAFFWISPLSWVLKKNIALNTELQADAKVIDSENKIEYANILLALTQSVKGSMIMNHFSAYHLKSRIIQMTKMQRHKQWVSGLSLGIVFALFFLISCEATNSSEVMIERMGEVKTITTRFISHQSDTQQKTGKIVAIASFGPDGVLEEMVEQTTYPYDREFEVKKYFWDTPDRAGIPYMMDGLSLGVAEKSFAYGHDWPSAYYKHLDVRSNSGDMPWGEIITTDNELMPTQIESKRKREENEFAIGMPDVTEFFEYEGEKVVRVLQQSSYPKIDVESKHYKKLLERFKMVDNEATKKFYKKRLEAANGKVGDIELTAEYTYDGDLLTSIKGETYERKFYYENELLIKSEYYKNEELINTRIHYYKNSLKDRTEIFNRYNEAEYTITYTYEFW